LAELSASDSLIDWTADAKRDPTKANLNRPLSKAVKKDNSAAAGESGHCCCKWSLRAIFGIISLAAALIFAIVTTVFNISLIHAGLSSISIISVKDIDDIKEGINDALNWLGLPYFGNLFNGLRVYFGWLDFVKSIGLKWYTISLIHIFGASLLTHNDLYRGIGIVVVHCRC
jgi:hypothetical protein